MENSSQSSSSSSSSSSASSSSSSSSSTTVNPISQGCGLHTQISVHINPTTGGDFYLTVDNDIAVDNLKKLVSKRLKVPRDRICLLFRDKQLQDGNLTHYGITDGSRITLLPNVETGLITQRPEIGIMQALESLNDTQVNEFLCGKAPLNLSMRLGDHMMLIQLQLSTVSGTKPPLISTPTSSSSPPSPAPPPIPPPPPPPSSAPTSPPSLLQASRNLQHTLRRLSADVFSGRDKGRRESVYSGTFSGALNPALQDPKGRPRRDVATIVHILNDLLCSVPEFRRVNNNSNNNNNNNNTNSNDVDKNREEPVVPVELDEDLPITTPTTTTTTNNEDQNLRTRGKLEQLRLVMGERRERRRQRKQKPYSLPPTSDTDTVTA